jgi:hypothetical protein
MADPGVLYYPPLTGYPFLVVTIPGDGAIEVQAFPTEGEAETFAAEKTGLLSPLE